MTRYGRKDNRRQGSLVSRERVESRPPRSFMNKLHWLTCWWSPWSEPFQSRCKILWYRKRRCRVCQKQQIRIDYETLKEMRKMAD